MPEATAGSHLDVYTPSVPQRQYSIYSGPADRDAYIIAVKREVDSRGGSEAMHARLAERDMLTVGAPRNHFHLVDNEGTSILLAGSVGITPILAMVQTLLREARDFQHHFFIRSEEHLAFRDLLSTDAFAQHTTKDSSLTPNEVRNTIDALFQALNSEGRAYVAFYGDRRRD